MQNETQRGRKERLAYDVPDQTFLRSSLMGSGPVLILLTG